MEEYIPQTPTMPLSLAELTPGEMLAVGGPAYQPPYETLLEDELAWHLVKYLNRQVNLRSQVRVPTPCGVFWVDFVLEYQDRRIAIECGALETNENARQQQYRDALIMGSGTFEVLYRLRGHDLFHHMEDLAYVLSQAQPHFFTERGRINLRQLASPDAHMFSMPERGTMLTVAYSNHKDGNTQEDVRTPACIKRLRLKCATDWVRDHDAALRYYGRSEPLAKSA